MATPSRLVSCWVVLALLVALSDSVQAQVRRIAPRASTPQDVVLRMLLLASVSSSDTVLDAGCGDGRIVIEAVRRYGARGICIELDDTLFSQAVVNAQSAGVADRLSFRKQVIREADFGGATVVTLFLTPAANSAIIAKLRALPSGSRIVSLQYHLGAAWKYDQDSSFFDARGIERTIYLWNK